MWAVPSGSDPHRDERLCLLGDKCAQNENLAGNKLHLKTRQEIKLLEDFPLAKFIHIINNHEAHSVTGRSANVTAFNVKKKKIDTLPILLELRDI